MVSAEKGSLASHKWGSTDWGFYFIDSHTKHIPAAFGEHQWQSRWQTEARTGHMMKQKAPEKAPARIFGSIGLDE